MLRWIMITGTLLSVLLVGAVHLTLGIGADDLDGAGITFVTPGESRASSVVRLYAPKHDLELTVYESRYMVHDIAWSPDGERLYFTATRRQERTGSDLAVYDTRTGAVTWLVVDNDNSNPAPSPDGRWLAFSRNAVTGTSDDIFLLDLTTGEYKLLYQGAGNDRYPTWSIDGQHIIFSGLDAVRNISILSISATDDTPATSELIVPNGYQPALSPADNTLTYVRANAGDGPQSGADLYLYHPTTGTTRLLAQTSTSDLFPAWAPAGNQVAYLTVHRGQGYLYGLDPRTGIMRRLWPDAVSVVAPVWRP